MKYRASNQTETHCEWGENGLLRGPRYDAVIIVDVLSFSTCVEVAVARGASIVPCLWRDASARRLAQSHGAELAGPRGGGGYSLSPASVLDVPSGTRIVLPSLNGARLSLLSGDAPTFAGCLRNAAVVAAAAAACGTRIAIIPAGEQWPDGSLRPALEDWLGAGAIISHLGGYLAPEAEAARASFRAHAADLETALMASLSGRELIDRGYEEDVHLAAESDVSGTVPWLQGGVYHRMEDVQAPLYPLAG